MSTWKISGQSSDFTSDPEDLIEALLNNGTNWTETTPARSSIKFGNDWWDGYGSFQIHVIKGRYQRVPQTNDWKKYRYNQQIEIHVFARRNGANKPAEWGNMERQIEKIISQNKTGIGQGISVGSITGFEDMGANDNQKSTWHSMMTCEILYFKVDTS